MFNYVHRFVILPDNFAVFSDSDLYPGNLVSIYQNFSLSTTLNFCEEMITFLLECFM